MKDETWASVWTLLEERFGHDATQGFREFYRSRIEPRLSEEEFREAATRILDAYPWREDQPYRFPRPVDFVYALDVDRGHRDALIDWATVTDALERPTEERQKYVNDNLGLEGPGRQALDSLGGIRALDGIRHSELMHARREFLQAHEAWREPPDRVALEGADELPLLREGSA